MKRFRNTLPSCSRCLLVALGLALLSVRVAAAQSTPGLDAATVDKVERAVTSAMAQGHIPGLSAAIVVDRQLRWSNGYGMADLENFVPAKSATVYRLGSISKPITATAVMQLVERSKLDLDAPVQKYCAAFPVKSGRSLRANCSGISAGSGTTTKRRSRRNTRRTMTR